MQNKAASSGISPARMDSLIAQVRAIHASHRDEINDLKHEGQWERADWIWEALLEAFSTMGNSRGVVLVQKSEFHDPIRYGELAGLSPKERHDRLLTSVRNAKVRMPDQKVAWLMTNFQRILQSGGPEAVKKNLEAVPGRDEKIGFLRTSFVGIGEKLASNMMMIVYHPDFRDSIAIDIRIKNISKAIGLSLKSYIDEEAFYLEVAHRAGLSGWELDRLLYEFTKDLLVALSRNG